MQHEDEWLTLGEAMAGADRYAEYESAVEAHFNSPEVNGVMHAPVDELDMIDGDFVCECGFELHLEREEEDEETQEDLP
jgi:hypothetical protein